MSTPVAVLPQTNRLTARRLVGLTVEAPLADPLALATRLGPLRCAWDKPMDGDSAVGVGVALEVEASNGPDALRLIRRLSRPGTVTFLSDGPADTAADDRPCPPGPWFGGLAFDPSRTPGGVWSGFPATRWTVPELLVWTRAGRLFLTAFGSFDGPTEAARAALRQTLLAARRSVGSGALVPTPTPGELAIHTDRTSWDALMDLALARIDDGTLRKVVLARPVDVRAPQPFDVAAVLARLRTRQPGSRTFLLTGRDGSHFVGATPETICRLDGDELATEALAGSAPTGGGAALCRSAKDRHEHRLVVDGIAERLRPLVTRLDIAPEPGLLELAHVVHLRTPICGTLRPGVEAADIIATLHPTPATNGTPRDRALAFLAEHERLDRGWYAGVVGWIGAGADGAARADLAVGLRSAVLRGATARLFVGAGIVAGSTADGEWHETELKSRAVLTALGS